MDSVRLLQWVFDLHSGATNFTKRSESERHFQRYPDITTRSKEYD